jgi:hypothetical protein
MDPSLNAGCRTQDLRPRFNISEGYLKSNRGHRAGDLWFGFNETKGVCFSLI